MSDSTYTGSSAPNAKKLVWLHGEIKSPPFSHAARIEAGYLLRRLQAGDILGMPHSRPMPAIGPGCHELRIRDESAQWRIIYQLASDVITIANVYTKKTRRTPQDVIETSKARLRRYYERRSA